MFLFPSEASTREPRAGPMVKLNDYLILCFLLSTATNTQIAMASSSSAEANLDASFDSASVTFDKDYYRVSSSPAGIRLRERFGLVFVPGQDGMGHLVKVSGTGREGDKNETQPFEYDVYNGNKEKNQARYDDIGLLVDEIVYHLLERRTGLERVHLRPRERDETPLERLGFFFASPGFKKANKVMVLIHGSGVVRAGQWARRVIINDNVDAGTQLPYIERAKARGFGIIVMNTNHNSYKNENGERVSFADSPTPEDHAYVVWTKHISPLISKGVQVVVVAHSFGGHVTFQLANTFEEDFLSGVICLALTDSVHMTQDVSSLSRPLRAKLSRISKNYVKSAQPLGEHLGDLAGIPEVSAGHEKHEWTSHSAISEVFKQVDDLAKIKPANTEL